MDTPNATSRIPVEAPERYAAMPADLMVHSWQARGEMVIELELGFGGRLDEHLLAQAGDLLLDVEPVLGCRLVLDPLAPHWQRVPESERNVLTVTQMSDQYEHFRRTGLDATQGAQVELCLWRREGGDCLLIKMTHAVGDGIGLQLLAGRLSSLYSELSGNPAYRPGPSANVARDFAQILSGVPRRAYPRLIWDFIWFLAPRLFPRRTHVLPLPHESVRPFVPVLRRLNATRLSALSRYGKARGATLNDLFLAAAYRALASRGAWDGGSGLRICVTVDLRRWCLEPGRGDAICNLSSFDCPFLVRDLGQNFDDTLANVSGLMRRRKKSWLGLAPALAGYFLVKSRGYDGLVRAGRKRRSRRSHRPGGPMTLSNEGPLDKLRLRFAEHTPVSAHILPPFIELPGVHICLSGYNGALTMAAVTPQNGRATIESFLDDLIAELPAQEAATKEIAGSAGRREDGGGRLTQSDIAG
jgi:NRPS condensation-like uncharacterized protein